MHPRLHNKSSPLINFFQTNFNSIPPGLNIWDIYFQKLCFGEGQVEQTFFHFKCDPQDFVPFLLFATITRLGDTNNSSHRISSNIKTPREFYRHPSFSILRDFLRPSTFHSHPSILPLSLSLSIIHLPLPKGINPDRRRFLRIREFVLYRNTGWRGRKKDTGSVTRQLCGRKRGNDWSLEYRWAYKRTVVNTHYAWGHAHSKERIRTDRERERKRERHAR